MFFIKGEFLRVRTNLKGEAFNAIVDFDTPFATKAKSNYTLSMYTLVNCPKTGCQAAQDKISVQIKEGINGVYREVYVVQGRVHDDRWKMDKLDFIASSDRTYVCLISIKKVTLDSYHISFSFDLYSPEKLVKELMVLAHFMSIKLISSYLIVREFFYFNF